MTVRKEQRLYPFDSFVSWWMIRYWEENQVGFFSASSSSIYLLLLYLIDWSAHHLSLISFPSVIPLDDSDNLIGSQGSRSFSLLRLKTIEEQRNQAAITFDSDQLQQCQDSEQEKNAIAASRLTYSPDLNFKRLRVFDPSRVLSPSVIQLNLKTIVYSEENPTGRPATSTGASGYGSHYIYDNDSFEADDEADFEDLLSASVMEASAVTGMTATTSDSPRDWTPSRSSSRRSHQQQQLHSMPPTQVKLRPKSRLTRSRRTTFHRRVVLDVEEEVAAAASADGFTEALSIRGQNCANAPQGRYVWLTERNAGQCKLCTSSAIRGWSNDPPSAKVLFAWCCY